MISFRYNILIYYFYVIIWTIKILFVYNFISFENNHNFKCNLIILYIYNYYVIKYLLNF